MGNNVELHDQENVDGILVSTRMNARGKNTASSLASAGIKSGYNRASRFFSLNDTDLFFFHYP